MSADPWTTTRRDFERLLGMGLAEREAWFRAEEVRDAASARELRALLAADEAGDDLLDTDAPTLHAEWSRRRGSQTGIGTDVAGYRLAEVLGEGGSAIVFRAEGAAKGVSEVAIKILKPEACSPGLSRRFEQERETLTGLDHPGLIRVLGAGRLDDGRPYLVTEFVRGVPIDAFCERRELELPARLRLFVEVCRAVQHAHSHLVVHRDLKPSNILVSADGRTKVLDFGVAKLLDPARDPSWTDQYGRSPFTLAFASPEQVRGESITTASDIYSLGVLLHELVIRASPYAEPPADREALERAVALGLRRTPEAAAQSVGAAQPAEDLAAILERALALAPGDRYASAEHLAEDIVCFLENRPLRSRSEPWKRRVILLARRRPWAIAGGGALLLLSIGSWIGTRQSLSRVQASESVAWRAHANAVRTTNLLADLLERIGASAVAGDELSELVSETEQHLADLGDQPEAEARLRIALARLERARARPGAAETHLARALDLSRRTTGLSWMDTERCLEQWSALRAQRADPSSIDLARERLDLLVAHGDASRAAEARQTLDSLTARFARPKTVE